MKAIQRFLLSSPGFVGLITPGSIGNPMGYVKGHLYRDPVLDGPKFSSFSFGDWLGPQLEKIARKLTENYYKTNFPLELFAYSEHDDPDGHVDSRHEFEECVRKHLPNLKFIRVHLFYLAHKKYLYSIPLL